MAARDGSRSGAVGWRRLAMVVLLLVLPLVAVELGIRVLIATDRLPMAAAHTPEFEITWENLSRLGTADVLILGDSVSQQGIEPAELARLLLGELEHGVKVFNAASPGGTVGVNWAIVEQLAREGRLPRVVILGVYPGTLGTDRTYQDVFSRTPMGGVFSGCDRMQGYGERLDCGFAAISDAWRWRGHPDRILRALGTEVPRRIASGGLQLREDGFRVGRGVSLQRLQAQLDRANLRRRIFVFQNDVADGYARLVESLHANGVSIVPVAIPDTPALAERMEPRQPGRRQLFREALDALESRTGSTFIDPVAFGDWWGGGEARNFNHLSGRGAIKFTRQLWGMPEFRTLLLDALAAR
jgi:hypothetical protein